MGPLRTLHQINPTRISYIKKRVLEKKSKEVDWEDNPFPLEGIRILDVGCGAGILSEPLARLGANVVGLDASANNIRVAKLHAEKDPVLGQRLVYVEGTAESLLIQRQQFDAVCALEVIEHVTDPKDFVRSLLHLAKPGGKVIFSTINRTSPSYLLAIVAAEKILGLMDNGTHDWNKFVTPEELSNLVVLEGGKVDDITGLSYNPITRSATLTLDSSVNYFLCVSKT